MATLAEVIAGIARDVVMARRESDLVSRDLAAQYRADPLLRYFDVPHVRLTDIAITLRFAFAQAQTQAPAPASPAPQAPFPPAPPPRWIPVVTGEVLPQALQRVTGDGYERVQREISDYIRNFAASASEEQFLSAARNGAAMLAAETSKAALNVFAKMRSTLAEIADPRALEAEVRAAAERPAAAFIAALQAPPRREEPRRPQSEPDGGKVPSPGPLQVIVDSAALALLPASSIQEIKFVIHGDDISADPRGGIAPDESRDDNREERAQ